MTRFPTSGHLASWTKFTPEVSESAGKKKGKKATSHGAPYLARVLGEAARRRGPHRFLSRRALPADRPPTGQKKAIVAVGPSILVITGTCSQTPASATTTSAPTSATATRCAAMSASSKLSATKSPSNQPLYTTRPAALRPWYCRGASWDR